MRFKRYYMGITPTLRVLHFDRNFDQDRRLIENSGRIKGAFIEQLKEASGAYDIKIDQVNQVSLTDGPNRSVDEILINEGKMPYDVVVINGLSPAGSEDALTSAALRFEEEQLPLSRIVVLANGSYNPPVEGITTVHVNPTGMVDSTISRSLADTLYKIAEETQIDRTG